MWQAIQPFSEFKNKTEICNAIMVSQSFQVLSPGQQNACTMTLNN
jgi:hypothetical protein